MKILSNPFLYTSDNAVTIWDDVCPELVEDMYKIRSKPKWSFANTSKALAGSNPITSWGLDICNFGEQGKSPEELEQKIRGEWENISKEYPFVPKLWCKIKELVEPDIKMTRVFVNGQTYGLGDNIHPDTRSISGITFVYYFNPQWDPEWDGQTIIYTNEGEILASILPKPGRLIGFDSRLLHRGTSPSRFCNKLRCTLAFHTYV